MEEDILSYKEDWTEIQLISKDDKTILYLRNEGGYGFIKIDAIVLFRFLQENLYPECVE